MVQLTDDLREILDAEATRRGVSRSALIREAIAAYFSEAAEAMVTRQIIEGYTRVPPVTPDEWGDLEATQDHSARETFRRLDAEERAAGLEPW